MEHALNLDEERSPKLGPSVRMERHFYCTCGNFRAFGYDNAIMAAFRAHKKEN